MIFAHQGGWDEMLMVLGPIAVIVLLLRLARRRAIRSGAVADEEEATDASTAAEDGDGPPTAPG